MQISIFKLNLCTLRCFVTYWANDGVNTVDAAMERSRRGNIRSIIHLILNQIIESRSAASTSIAECGCFSWPQMTYKPKARTNADWARLSMVLGCLLLLLLFRISHYLCSNGNIFTEALPICNNLEIKCTHVRLSSASEVLNSELKRNLNRVSVTFYSHMAFSSLSTMAGIRNWDETELILIILCCSLTRTTQCLRRRWVSEGVKPSRVC